MINNSFYSIHYSILLTVFLISVPGTDVTAQERVAYRVEVIVFRLLQSDFQAVTAQQPRNYANVLDLEKLELERQAWMAAWADMEPVDAGMADLIPPLTPGASQFWFADGIEHIPEMSEQMSGVWRNLRLSAEYRPEVYLSWRQRAEGDFPALRLHNEEIILFEDAFADQRTRLSSNDPNDEDSPLLFFHYDLENGSVTLAPLPDPISYYSLDGSVRLRRSRFLHIDLDLEHRIPTPATLSGMSGPPLQLKHQGYMTHSLQQSRQVRTARMEYFDSPVVGVLIWITAIEKVEQDIIQ